MTVRWNDAPIGDFLANYDSSLSFEYTIDVNPSPANELGLKSVLYKMAEPEMDGGVIKRAAQRHHGKVESSPEAYALLERGHPEVQKANRPTEANYKYEVSFDNICDEEEMYTVTISTELNGRTVTQMVEKFPMGSRSEEEEAGEEKVQLSPTKTATTSK